MAQQIKLTESELKATISKYINEALEDEGFWGSLKGGAQGLGRALKQGGGEGFLGDRWKRTKDFTKASAQTGNANDELSKLGNTISSLMQKGILGNQNTQTYQAAERLITLINGSTNAQNGQHSGGKIRGNNGRLQQNFNRNFGQ